MTARLLTPTALRAMMLAWWTAAFGAGVYAGYKIAYFPVDSSSWGVFGLLVAVPFWVAVTIAYIAIPALVAALLYRALFKGRLPEARTVMIAAALYVAGVVAGIVMTPVLGLEYRYREPVVLEARGTMTLSLDGLAGYAARSDVLAICGSMSDGEGVSEVSATAVGTLAGVDVDASIAGIELEFPTVGIGGVPTVDFKFVGWSGPAALVEETQGGRNGRVTFVGAALDNNGAGDPVPGDLPTTLSGTLTWSCGDWIGPVSTPGPGPSS